MASIAHTMPLDIVRSIVMMARPQRPELDDLRDMIHGFDPRHTASLAGGPFPLNSSTILQIVKCRRERGHRSYCPCRHFGECCENPSNYTH